MLSLRRAAQVVTLGQQVEDHKRGGGDRRGDRVGEQVRAGPLSQHVDDLLVPAHVPAARATERLSERAGDDVDTIGHTVQLGGSASVLTDESDGVRVVDHHHGAIAVRQLADLAQGCHVPVHREHPVGRDQPAACVGSLSQLVLEMGHVPVVIPVAPRGAQPDAVDDGRVVQLVADDGVVLAQQGLEEPPVRVEAR